MVAVHKESVGSGVLRGKSARMLGAVVLVAVLLGLIFVISRPKSIPADLTTVERGAMEVTLDEEGETRVRDRFVVSAPVAGRILRIELEPGDPVVAGETVLATFQPVDPGLLDARTEAEARARARAAKASLGRAEADRKRAQAEMEFALRDLERQERLSQDQVVAADRLDKARLEADRTSDALNAAKFAVRAARFELEMAEASLMHASGGASEGQPLSLTSPVDGVVLNRSRESEAVVPSGEPLLEVADPSRMEIVSDFLSTDAVKIKPGQPVLIEQWGGDQPLNGEVRRVEPSGFTKISALGVEEQRVNVIIDLVDPRDVWQALGDGFRIEARVVIWRGEDVVQVPTSTLFRHQAAATESGTQAKNGGWAVFRLEEGIARVVPVEIGQRNRLSAEVVSGLAVGDQVIAHPSDDVSDGVGIAPRN